MVEKQYKIKRRRPPVSKGKMALWLAGFVGAIGVSLAIANSWQNLQIAAKAQQAGPIMEQGASQSADAAAVSALPDASQAEETSAQPLPVPPGSSAAGEASGGMQPPAEPIVVGPSVAAAQPKDGQDAAAQESFDVDYQVPQGEAVDESYFDDALFVGDSITTGISIYQAMAGAQVVASTGINPNTILTKPVIRDAQGGLHTILEAMSAYQPAKIYLLLGANGVGWIRKETFVESYETFVGQIRDQHPGAVLYVQSIFPVTQEKSLSENGIYANEKIDEYNQAIMEMCERLELPYLNVAQTLRGKDGALPAEASTDGIHLKPAYYQKWFDYLKTHTLLPDKDFPGQAESRAGSQETENERE